MRYNRSVPFGYQVVDGVLCIHPVEAQVVKDIFATYSGGSSYKAIADALDGGPVPYGENCDAWNKCTVKRILENTRYTGETAYPAIISAGLFASAKAVRESKTQNYREPPEAIVLIRKQLVCAICGRTYRRGPRHQDHVCWQCWNEDCDNSGSWKEDDLLQAVIEAMNALIRQPELVDLPDVHIQRTSPELGRLNNDLLRQVEARAIDTEATRGLILALAAERYRLCDDGKAARDAAAMRALLEQARPGDTIDGALFQNLVSQVLVSPSGPVSLRIRTGQVIHPTDRCDPTLAGQGKESTPCEHVF